MITIPKVSIIILQFNNSEDTIRCLESVRELKYGNLEVIVIDNASAPEHQQNTKNYLASQDNLNFKFKILNLNLGYSGGNNEGIKQALENKADYVFILNPDVLVEPDLLDKLVAKAESDEKIGIVGPAVNEGDRIVYGGEISWLKPELNHSHKAISHKLYVIGSSMLIKKKVIEKIGLFDERYFLYFEDADFNVRAQKARFKLALEPEAIAKHSVSSSTGSLGPAKLLYYHYRNVHLFNIKNGPIWAKLLLPFWSIYVILKQLAKILLIPSKRSVSIAILMGVMDFYMGRFGKMANNRWTMGNSNSL
ncbi:MAG: glycosyltransferase family 2 protein [bacterium]|nr:glycosyltransferase family 2 protein [bacterium]